MTATTENSAAQQLKALFGDYKAEWLRGRIFDLFTQPAYFPELETQGPCILVGGRGTGKTTVLGSLSYEGRFALSGMNAQAIRTWPYLGFYYRIDTNRVTAFRGPELRQDTWTKLFSHYFNMVLCGQVLHFLKWYSEKLPNEPSLSAAACRRVAIGLHLTGAESVSTLLDNLDDSRLRFEAYLNNLHQDRLPPLSLHGAPIDELINGVNTLPQFKDKYFFFLLDEYENLLDDQQVVVNTLIKHSGANYSFKIGVRELG
jgi:Cdc6-like AAA superfamily ATPase